MRELGLQCSAYTFLVKTSFRSTQLLKASLEVMLIFLFSQLLLLRIKNNSLEVHRVPVVHESQRVNLNFKHLLFHSEPYIQYAQLLPPLQTPIIKALDRT